MEDGYGYGEVGMVMGKMRMGMGKTDMEKMRMGMGKTGMDKWKMDMGMGK